MLHALRQIFLFFLIVLLASCQPSKEKMQQSIVQQENDLYKLKENDFRIDTTKAHTLITLYEQFAHRFKNDSMAAEYLFRAADLYRSLNMIDNCLALHDRIIRDFPQSSRAPYSLFLKGFLYENEKNDLTKAKELYEEFLRLYPHHTLADDVKFSVAHLGKSPEELIRFFEQMNKDSLAP